MKIDVENESVVLTLSNIVQFNVEIHNLVSTLLNVVNCNADVHNVASTLIWRCATSRLHINLKRLIDVEMFAGNSFKKSLQKAISKNLGAGCDEIYESFSFSCNKILDNHAPLKKNYVRGNRSPFMNKSLSKAIMVRTRLRNIFLKNRSEENKINFNKQRNLCATLLGKSKREYIKI